MEQSQEVIDFLHDNYFSVVAGDQPGFEKWPPPADPILHSILLPLWGLPIGEMWDLEELSEVCRQRKQHTFFFASTPANVPGESRNTLYSRLLLMLSDRWRWQYLECDSYILVFDHARKVLDGG